MRGLDGYGRAASQGRVSAMRTTMTAFIVLSLRSVFRMPRGAVRRRAYSPAGIVSTIIDVLPLDRVPAPMRRLLSALGS